VSNKLRTIADALANGLSASASVASSATVERKNWATIDAADMDRAVVLITPGGIDTQRIGRNAWQSDYTVYVFVGRQCNTDADVNGTIDLADEVMTLIKKHSWSEAVTWPENVFGANSVTIEVNPDDALNDRNVWRGVISAVYRVASVETA
jgi:hypothetical protein